METETFVVPGWTIIMIVVIFILLTYMLGYDMGSYYWYRKNKERKKFSIDDSFCSNCSAARPHFCEHDDDFVKRTCLQCNSQHSIKIY